MKGQLVSVFDDPPRKNVFLLSCMDQRLLDDTVQFMNKLNLENRYDQLAVAGGGMGVLRLPEGAKRKSARWWKVFTDHLKAAIEVLHRPIKDVFLFDHLDCGAYKYLHPNKALAEAYRNASLVEMGDLHHHELRKLAGHVRKFCDRQRELAEADYNKSKMACGADTECWERTKDAAWEKVKAWTDIRVSCFIMDLCGEVTQYDVPSGQRCQFDCTCC